MSWTEIQEVDGGVTIDVGGVGAEIKVTEAPKPKKVKIKADPVNNPAHYTAGGIETIDFIQAKLTPEEFQGYLKGNIIKYTSRAGKKNELVEDFEKGQWYMNRLVQHLKG